MGEPAGAASPIPAYGISQQGRTSPLFWYTNGTANAQPEDVTQMVATAYATLARSLRREPTAGEVKQYIQARLQSFKTISIDGQEIVPRQLIEAGNQLIDQVEAQRTAAQGAPDQERPVAEQPAARTIASFGFCANVDRRDVPRPGADLKGIFFSKVCYAENFRIASQRLAEMAALRKQLEKPIDGFPTDSEIEGWKKAGDAVKITLPADHAEVAEKLTRFLRDSGQPLWTTWDDIRVKVGDAVAGGGNDDQKVTAPELDYHASLWSEPGAKGYKMSRAESIDVVATYRRFIAAFKAAGLHQSPAAPAPAPAAPAASPATEEGGP